MTTTPLPPLFSPSGRHERATAAEMLAEGGLRERPLGLGALAGLFSLSFFLFFANGLFSFSFSSLQ
jgi:hypothetical protein